MLVKADGTLKSPLKKLLSVTAEEELLHKTGAKAGDLLLIAASSLHVVVRNQLQTQCTKDRRLATSCSLTLPLYFAAPSAGSSSSAVCRAAGVSRRHAPRSLCFSLPMGCGFSSLFAPRGGTGGAGVSSSSLHCCAA